MSQIRIKMNDVGWIFGEYTCLASNKLGDGQEQIELRRASRSLMLATHVFNSTTGYTQLQKEVKYLE